MIVTFTTTAGSKYHLDHTEKMWVQETPQVRNGPLYNTPAVRIGKPVVISTADPDGKRILKVIETAPVATREVSFA